jgi:hypothetical protein
MPKLPDAHTTQFPQESTFMAANSHKPSPAKRWRLTVDGWAVTIALVLALLVRLGLIHRVPW